MSTYARDLRVILYPISVIGGAEVLERMENMECKCAKCGEVKEIVALVDGLPWCEDCFDAALGGENH